MSDTPEIHESPEQQVIKTPEKKIDTFDDLKTSDKTQEIDTFDDVAMKQGSESSIKTYDDIAGTKETSEKTGNIEAKEKTLKDTPESLEQKRIEHATENIKKIDWMKPEKWKTLSNDEKRIALDHSGKALGDAYHSTDPPLATTEMKEPGELGEYGDGYTYDPERDKYNGHIEVNPSDFEGHGIVGSDYGIRMNEERLAERNKKLLDDNPKVALETYAHEFRHSYQNEQAHAFDKGFRTDNSNRAKEWSENLKDYKQPPDNELAKTEPERYFKEYEAYRNQPVEKDAREFGTRVVSELDKHDYIGKDK